MHIDPYVLLQCRCALFWEVQVSSSVVESSAGLLERRRPRCVSHNLWRWLPLEFCCGVWISGSCNHLAQWFTTVEWYAFIRWGCRGDRQPAFDGVTRHCHRSFVRRRPAGVGSGVDIIRASEMDVNGTMGTTLCEGGTPSVVPGTRQETFHFSTARLERYPALEFFGLRSPFLKQPRIRQPRWRVVLSSYQASPMGSIQLIRLWLSFHAISWSVSRWQPCPRSFLALFVCPTDLRCCPW
ncbi:hypothetical protein C8R44DRAFT_307448 [Mycena epipterygia]|nr:hypothetical protein C8R44DRAFT_307448 [Mycena epipterygia]